MSSTTDTTTDESIATDRSDFPHSAGDIVVDREHPESEAVVVNVPAVPADEWTVADRTVAADNRHNDTHPKEPVVVVVYRNALEHARPYYTGSRPIKLSELSRDDVSFYAFPYSRLEIVGSMSPLSIRLDDIRPSPYHARNFDYEANAEFIDEIAARGYPKPFPLLRVTDDGFEVINGHKRIWASYVAGLDEALCWCVDVDRQQGAQMWARRHLGGYTDEEAAAARERIAEQGVEL